MVSLGMTGLEQEFVSEQEDARGEDAPIPGEQAPYRGLLPFTIADAPLFFGREAATSQLLALLRSASAALSKRFVTVVGSASSGKTSLVQAGALSALGQDALPHSSSWPLITCTPGAEPLERLARALLGATVNTSSPKPLAQLTQWLGASERTLHSFTQHVLQNAPADRRMVVFVDQFEELFTTCADDAQRQALVANLLHAANVSNGQVIVLVALRSEAYGASAPYTQLAEQLAAHQLLLAPLTSDERRRAIQEPAALSGSCFEPGLVETLLEESADLAYGLPRLQHTLYELWRRRDGQWLTASAYHAIGGVAESVEVSAELLYHQLSAPEQESLRQMLAGLLDTAPAGVVRRRASLQDFLAGQQPALAESLVRKLAAPPLELLTIRESADAAPAVEIAHEVAGLAWARVIAGVELYGSRPRPESMAHLRRALAALRLPTASRTAEAAGRPLTVIGRAIANDAKQWYRGYLRRSGAKERVGVGSLLLLVTILVLLWQITAYASHRHHVQFLVAHGQVVFEERPLLGLRLILEGLTIANDAETRAAALQALHGVSLKGRLLKISSDAEKVYPLNDNNTFILQRRHGQGQLHRTTAAFPVLLPGTVSSVYFNPDTPFYFIAFKEGGGELRRLDNDNVVPFTGDPEYAFFSIQKPFFVVRDANKLADLQSAHDAPGMLRDLSHNTGQYVYDPDTQRLVAVYESGDVYLLDVAWLRAIGDNPGALTEQELVSLACRGPLASALWTAYDQRELEMLLEGAAPQSCS